MIEQTPWGWVIQEDGCISSWVKEHKRLDWDYQGLNALHERLKPLNRWGVCLDIGAFIGDYTTTFSKWFDTVLAFEPNPEAYECLVRNVDKANTHCFNCAVGPAGMRYDMSINAENAGASQMLPGTDLPFMDLNGLGRVDFVKIDVEGGEPGVLEALRAVISRDHPAIHLEQRVFDGNEGRVKNFLGQYGYGWQVVSGEEAYQYDLYCI